MTIQTRPNRYRHGIMTVLEFLTVDKLPCPVRRETKAHARMLEDMQRCLNCGLAVCDEKKCRRK